MTKKSKKKNLLVLGANGFIGKNLLNYLRSGKVVAIASDQVPLLSGGEMSKFFGQECLSMSLLSKLSIKTDAKVHSMVCVREEGAKGFKILFSQKLEMCPSEHECPAAPI